MFCECCQCLPCDCDGVNNEFWGILQTADNKGRKDYNMASQPDRSTSESNSQVENQGKQSKGRILPKNLSCTCNFTGEAHKWDNRGSSEINED